MIVIPKGSVSSDTPYTYYWENHMIVIPEGSASDDIQHNVNPEIFY